jgi:hypothetical protein
MNPSMDPKPSRSHSRLGCFVDVTVRQQSGDFRNPPPKTNNQ